MQHDWKNYVMVNSKAIILSDKYKCGLLKKVDSLQYNDKVIIYMDKKEDPCFVACGGTKICEQTVKIGYVFIKNLFEKHYQLNGVSSDKFLELWHGKDNLCVKALMLVEDNIEAFYKCNKSAPDYKLLTAILLKTIDEVIEGITNPPVVKKTSWFSRFFKWGK